MNTLPEIIAYFSMEMALEPGMPTYCGGLGMLAGDSLRAAADHQLPMVGVTLLHRRGYFSQKLDSNGEQTEVPAQWDAAKFRDEQAGRAQIGIEGRGVFVRAWRYTIESVTGHEVPVFWLDTDLPENSRTDRTLTHYLYGGDLRYRLCQENGRASDSLRRQGPPARRGRQETHSAGRAGSRGSSPRSQDGLFGKL